MSLNAMHSLHAIAVNFVLEATILGKQGHGDERVCIQVYMHGQVSKMDNY